MTFYMSQAGHPELPKTWFLNDLIVFENMGRKNFLLQSITENFSTLKPRWDEAAQKILERRKVKQHAVNTAQELPG